MPMGSDPLLRIIQKAECSAMPWTFGKMSWLQKDAKGWLVHVNTTRMGRCSFFQPRSVCFQLHRVSSVFLPTLFRWLGQDGYFWVDKALWVIMCSGYMTLQTRSIRMVDITITICIIILKPASPRSNFNDGGEAASLSEETRLVWFWTVISWKTTWAAMKTTHVLSSKGVNVWCLRES